MFSISAYKCSQCDKSSVDAIELIRHFEECHPVESKWLESKGPFFECYICKCQLANHRTVRKHLKQHVAARDTKCKICHHYFTSNELLQWHICGNNDAQFREIPCEYCDESFRSLSKCEQHLENVHVDDRTIYQCRKCIRYFGMKQLRDFHEKYYPQHKKPFQCDICSRKFAGHADIKRHINYMHTGKGSFTSFHSFNVLAF